MTTKSPSFQFYPGDWLRNAIAGCPLEAQGLWLRMMIVMHDSDTYGQLSINGEPMSDEFIAKKVGISRKKYSNLIQILDKFGVINRKENGVIYSGRMERDERKRQQNAARQRDFYQRHKGEANAKPNAPPNAEPHATSSSSSSFSSKNKNDATASSSSPKKPKKSDPSKLRTRPDLEKDEYLAWLDGLPENREIDVYKVFNALSKYCRDRNERPNRKRLLNWLGRERDAIPMDATPTTVVTTVNAAPSQREAIRIEQERIRLENASVH